MSEPLRWEAPAKGDWRGLHDHFPRALTPEYRRLLATGMTEGEAAWFAEYGMPARTVEPAFVNGRVFITAAPLVGPHTDRTPPAAALWLATRSVPAFRRRARAARRAVAERRWLAEAQRWYDVERPAWEARDAALDAVDPAALDDAGLVAHLREARAVAEQGYRDHFRLHGCDLVPTGLFLARAADWGIDPHDAAGLLAGSSPASRGDRPLPAWRLVSGYDLDERCAAELPELPAPARPASSPDPEHERALRAQVPAADRDEWDRLLADARATYGVRDDNGLLTAAWPVGLLRRALLVAGDRLVERGRLRDREHVVELTVDEVVDAVLDRPGLDDPVGTVEARLAERRRLSSEPAPASIGPPADLPVQPLPAAMGQVVRALLTLRELGTTPPGERPPLLGAGIGTTAVRARACVADDPAAAFARFEPGDVVVTAATCPAWNQLLALAGGIVTEEGGPLSHAAVIARELGIPAVVGAADAVARIPDGAVVELDPAAGRVTVVTGVPETT